MLDVKSMGSMGLTYSLNINLIMSSRGSFKRSLFAAECS